jgi:diaminohydroxyphosphoribosylaminopyrimidine deaminase/5-amino-6-(5-phosphoribosylamino)uracil reductase
MTHPPRHPHLEAWSLIHAASAAARGGLPLNDGDQYVFDGKNLTLAAASDDPLLTFETGWRSLVADSDERKVTLDLYLPLVGPRSKAPLVLAQLGQSLDGFIATASGHSHFVTGPASILHLHCLRALSDCVIVGAGTVAADNPRLTTRLVSGANPVRVVLDPQLRLPITHDLFTDGQARTLRVRARGVPLHAALVSAGIEDLEVDAPSGKLDLRALVDELWSRGLQTILVEGGGLTVSAFLAADLIDRMHIVVAPFVIGEGRPGLRIPSAVNLQECLRPPPRVYTLGGDVLFDCDMRCDSRGQQVPSVIRRVL